MADSTAHEITVSCDGQQVAVLRLGQEPQIAPGPLAAQLAIYLGFVHYRVRGATLAGLAFVLPSFLMVLALGWAYVRFGGLSWMQSVFYGVGAAVIGIIAISAHKLTTKSIGKDKLLWGIFLALAAVTISSPDSSLVSSWSRSS